MPSADPAERGPRITRTLKRSALAIVLLPPAYLLSWLILSRAVNYGLLSSDAAAWVRPIYRPLVIYCDLRQPGAGTLTGWWWKFTAKHEVGEQQLGYFLGPQYPTLGVDK